MYEDYFGLKARPFRANPTGTDVFVGPQMAKAVKGLQSAFVGADSIAVITGAPGVGKSTLVARALETFGNDLMLLRLPRVKLGHDEVLEFLLENLGVADAPLGTLRRAIACRDAVSNCEKEGRRLCVIVEDAHRIGADALIELEALTAADGFSNSGANLVLLGDPALIELLGREECSRISQRTRLRFRVEPLSNDELRGYLKHSFRIAGTDPEQVFADDSSALLHELTGGIPRNTNNLVEGLLEAAADQQLRPITPAFVRRIAAEQFGLSVSPGPAESSTITAETLALTEEDIAVAEQETAATQPARILPAPATNSNLPDLDELTAELAATAPASDACDSGTESGIPTLFSSVRMTSPALETTVAKLEEAASLVRNESEIVTVEVPELEPEKAVEPVQGAGYAVEALDEPEAQSEPAALTDPEVQDPPTIEPQPAATAELTPKTEAAAETRTDTESAAEPAAESAAESATESAVELSARTVTEPVEELLDEPVDKPVAEPLAALASESKPEPENDAAPESAPEPIAPDAHSTPAEVLEDVQPAPEDAAPATNAPEWERDPTLAELRPDLEALEEAMAQSYEEEAQEAPKVETPDPVINLKEPTFIGLPEITLDVAIQQKIDEATEALERHDATIAEEDIEDAPVPLDAVADREAPVGKKGIPDEIVDSLSNARSLEDVDDKMAETLFGEEFAALAAEAVANRPAPVEPETELTLDEAEFDASELELLEPEPSQVASADTATDDEESGESAMEREFREVYGDNALEVSLQSDTPRGLDLSASQRLATVRALNANKNASSTSIRMTGTNGAARPASTPQPIEEQISTSMTQTLRALGARQNPANDDDDDEQPKGGFFSRFRRS